MSEFVFQKIKAENKLSKTKLGFFIDQLYFSFEQLIFMLPKYKKTEKKLSLKNVFSWNKRRNKYAYEKWKLKNLKTGNIATEFSTKTSRNIEKRTHS